jgi:hypothetical protein
VTGQVLEHSMALGWLSSLLAAWLSFGLFAGEAKAPGNLVPNGDFEKGSGDRPADWQRPDGLTTFWVKSTDRKGRHIQIDTDVLASQFREREDEMRRASEEKKEPGPPPRRKPTREPKYDTVAGLDGVHYASAEIPFKPEKYYKLMVDVKVDGRAGPKVWVKAYAAIRSGAGAGRGIERKRVVWKKGLDCEGASSRWRTYSTVFQVKTSPPLVAETLKVMLYPYWPPATFHFDDVRLFEISEAEARAFEAESGKQRKSAPLERNGGTGGEGE